MDKIAIDRFKRREQHVSAPWSTARKGDLVFRERVHDRWLWFKAAFKRRQLDRDLVEELQFNLASVS